MENPITQYTFLTFNSFVTTAYCARLYKYHDIMRDASGEIWEMRTRCSRRIPEESKGHCTGEAVHVFSKQIMHEQGAEIHRV